VQQLNATAAAAAADMIITPQHHFICWLWCLDQSTSALLGRKPGVTDLTSSLFSSFIPTAVEHTVEMKAKADYTHCNTPREW
jgi:hypothetical protein